jgi:hypothetical protein
VSEVCVRVCFGRYLVVLPTTRAACVRRCACARVRVRVAEAHSWQQEEMCRRGWQRQGEGRGLLCGGNIGANNALHLLSVDANPNQPNLKP